MIYTFMVQPVTEIPTLDLMELFLLEALPSAHFIFGERMTETY